MELARNSYPRVWKRAFDIALSIVGLLLFALPMAMVAAAIRISSGSPVVFSQERIGRSGRVFRVRKFRTMRVRGEPGMTVTVEGDARITPIGRLLRRWKLDELPQLWNVLVGQMSFVGPRPDVTGFADTLKGDDRRVLLMRPGITGPATLFYRNEEEILTSVPDPVKYNREVIYPHKVRMNLEYLDHCSFMGDLGYIWKTVVSKKWESSDA
jgi:lipopolysaccharide/colanic/teichoic acid biosynthesis glycosyltransferase